MIRNGYINYLYISFNLGLTIFNKSFVIYFFNQIEFLFDKILSNFCSQS
jgi:hypothetical protein